MNVPLATDNLYKFMALSGLAVSLFFPIYFWGKIQSLQIEIVRVETEVAVLGVDVDRLKYETEKLDDELGQSLKNFDTAELNNVKEKKDNLLKQHEIYKQRSVQLRTEFYENERKRKLLGGKRVEIIILRRQMAFQLVFLLVGWILGVVLTYIGFRLWYVRLQRYQDAEIKNKIEV